MLSDVIKSSAVQAMVIIFITVGSLFAAGAAGLFDSFISSYIFDSFEAVVSSDNFDDRGPTFPYAKCETDEKLVGGTCAVQTGNGSLQNFGIENLSGTPIFRCAFKDTQASTNGPFKGVASAICLRLKN